MQSDGRVVAVTTAFIMCLAGAVMLSLESDAEQEYDKSLGSFWSYTVQFIFDGSSTQSIEWDFGDGTTSTEWNPKHTFSDKGTYYVTQTLTNTVGTTSSVYKVEILGFPYITLVYNNGSENGVIQQTAYRVAAEQPDEPVRDGYTFTGWFTDSGCTSAYDWSSDVTSPVTLYAGWSEDPVVRHQVSFDVNGGSVDMDAVSIADGETFTVPDYTGSRDGFTFSGWMVGVVPYDVGSKIVVDGNMTLVAQWVQITHTVTFDSNGGSSVSPQTVAHGGKATVPTQPTKTGYTFVQWNHNGSEYDFDTIVADDITLVAERRVDSTPVDPPTYHKVRFESDGEALYTMSVKGGGKATQPENPDKDGFTFIGWYLDGHEYDFSEPVVSDITLTAHWTAVDSGESGGSDGGEDEDDAVKITAMVAAVITVVLILIGLALLRL